MYGSAAMPTHICIHLFASVNGQDGNKSYREEERKVSLCPAQVVQKHFVTSAAVVNGVKKFREQGHRPGTVSASPGGENNNGPPPPPPPPPNHPPPPHEVTIYNKKRNRENRQVHRTKES